MTISKTAKIRHINVGIDFLWTDEGNSGRVNYIYSLVNALATLPSIDQPELVVFHLEGSPIERLVQTGYSRLKFQKLTDGCISRFTPTRLIVNKLSRMVTGRNLLSVLVPVPAGIVDFVIPCEHREVFRNVPRRIHWIVDFNCYHLPHLFPGDSLQENKSHIEQIVALGEELMFSSQDSLNDFRSFFPEASNQTHVLRFAVGLPDVCGLDRSFLIKKYAIREKYFVTPNTFWAHKNHQALIRAMQRCVEWGCDFDLVLTGKLVTHFGDGYASEIRRMVEEAGLGRRVHFLGLLDRNEQISLLRHSTAIIQPSRFEGWSTVVEEAKSLGRPLIVADIPIHREQVSEGMFFPPDDDQKLSQHMFAIAKGSPVALQPMNNYAEEIRRFGRAVADVIQGEGRFRKS
jgi:glycosyltransferase involved in cell wall biosynthesis